MSKTNIDMEKKNVIDAITWEASERKKVIVYLHGFGSSGQSSTVKHLRRVMNKCDVLAPDIPVNPAEALPFLKDYCKRNNPDLIIGTSMGGDVRHADAQLQSYLRKPCIENVGTNRYT